jgi:peptide/nickel transport system substrate-binding protein
VNHGRRGGPAVRWLSALAVVAALLAGACSGSEGVDPEDPPPPTEPPAPSTPRTPVDGGTLRVASGPLPTDWSPAAQIWDTSAQQVARGLYDRLAVYDANNQTRPELAETFEADADFLRWEITLRRGITFHDGSPLDAEAVRANLEAQRVSRVGADLLAPVTSITVRSARTVVVTMSAPWSTFDEVLATQVGVMAAPATLAPGGGAAPIGTGAFRTPAPGTTLDPEPEPGELRLEANPSYWKDGLPHLDGVRFLVRPDPTARVVAVTSGQADLVSADRPDQLNRLDDAAEVGTIQLVEDRNAESPKVAIALNNARPPFDQVEARRAVALVTDRRELTELALDGQGSMARGVISDPSPWFSDLPEPIPDPGRARGEARAYLDEFGEPVAAQLLVPTDPLLLSIATLWQTQLAEAGIPVTVVPVTDAELADLTSRGQYQAAMVVGFTSPHPDLYEPLFRGLPGEQPAESSNITRYVNPLVTAAFADARATDDVAQQVEEYRVVQEQLFIELPWLFLVQLRQAVGLDPAVRDATTWDLANGDLGLGQDGATVSLAQIWIDPDDGLPVPRTTTVPGDDPRGSPTGEEPTG